MHCSVALSASLNDIESCCLLLNFIVELCHSFDWDKTTVAGQLACHQVELVEFILFAGQQRLPWLLLLVVCQHQLLTVLTSHNCQQQLVQLLLTLLLFLQIVHLCQLQFWLNAPTLLMIAIHVNGSSIFLTFP